MHIMGTPVPRRDIEAEGTSRPGPLTKYFLSPEELAQLDPAKPIPPSHKKPLRFQPARRGEQLG